MFSPDAESVSWLRFALASVTVLGLMAGLAWGLKYFAMRGWIKGNGPTERIKILSTRPLDTRRRIVLVECDKHQYLLLLGTEGDLLLSTSPSAKSSKHDS